MIDYGTTRDFISFNTNVKKYIYLTDNPLSVIITDKTVLKCSHECEIECLFFQQHTRHVQILPVFEVCTLLSVV